MPLTAMQLHMMAMLQPQSDEESRLVGLYRLLDGMCQQHKDDKQVEPSVLHLARTIISMFDLGTGRLDQTTLDKKVRETVQEAGFDASTI